MQTVKIIWIFENQNTSARACVQNYIVKSYQAKIYWNKLAADINIFQCSA